jgi:hypothetical protein
MKEKKEQEPSGRNAPETTAGLQMEGPIASLRPQSLLHLFLGSDCWFLLMKLP